MSSLELRDELVRLSHDLGDEARGMAILGEGNVSASADRERFLVKASGSSLAALTAGDLTCVRFDDVLSLLDREHVTEEETEELLMSAVADEGGRKPSVESFLHAVCLREGDARWVGHTHTVAVNRILCSELGAEPFLRHVFPDAIVVCGPRPAVVPYVDPGLALGRAVRTELRRFREEYGSFPKLVLLENHGPVALGSSSTEVRNVLQMAAKWADILWGTYALGGPRWLPEEEAARIDGRIDEAHRRRELLRRRS